MVEKRHAEFPNAPKLKTNVVKNGDVIKFGKIDIDTIFADKLPEFQAYKQSLAQLYNLILANRSELILLYHSFEHVDTEHPFYVNRTVLTTPSLQRYCVLPIEQKKVVHSDEIYGIGEVYLRVMFGIDRKKGKHDRDIAAIRAYIQPFLLPFPSFQT